MNELQQFTRVFRCVVIATLAPVIFTAFVCMPGVFKSAPDEGLAKAAPVQPTPPAG